MDRLLEQFFGESEPLPRLAGLGPRRGPALNLWQDDETIHVEAELPGLTERDIELTVNGSELTIRGERPPLSPGDDTVVHRRERGAGHFSRVVHLPVDIDQDKVDATFNHGVLTISLPKAAVARARHIPVKTTTG